MITQRDIDDYKDMMNQQAKVTTALDVQVGGGHYKSKTIQPIEYIHANGLNYSEGAIVKYITRWRDKNGFEDLLKIKHYVDLLIEMEKRYVAKPESATHQPISNAKAEQKYAK